MDERTARESTMRDFGGVSRHREAARDARGVRVIEDFLQDLRVAARTMRRQRTYTMAAVLTLAIGIGGTTALGSAVYRVLLAPYPYANANRIVTVWQTDTKEPDKRLEVAPGNYLDWKERSRSFEFLAAAEPYSFDWIGPEGPERFQTTLVTGDFFPLQGLRPLLGRAFVREEFERGRDNVVVLAEQLWRTRFGSDSGIVGRTIVLDTTPRLVIGVMSQDAMRPYAAEMWAPKIFHPNEARSRTGGYWSVIGRLAPGVTIDGARNEMRALAAQLASEYPASNRSTGIAVVALREAMTSEIRTSLLVLFGAVAFVLLIACVNVTSLQLAETLRRRRELAIRSAIGAGRGRLLRQLLSESLLVTVIGAGAGLFVAYAGIGAIRAFAPADLSLQRFELDGFAVLLALALALVSAVAIAAMPTAATRRLKVAEALAGGARPGGASPARGRANRVLVVSEIALALSLLVGAGLMIRSLTLLGRTDRGFSTDGVLVTTVQAWAYYPTPARRAEFVRQAEERLLAIPGVEEVGVTSSLPLASPIGFERARFTIEGQTVAPGDELPIVRAAATTPGYFQALRIPIQQGRGFSPTDIAAAPLVVLVNRTFARRYFGDENPIGKRVAFGFMSAPVPREIVGVVGDVRHDGLEAEPTAGVFIPHAQGSTGAIHFVLRSSAGCAARGGCEPALLERRVRAELRAMNGAMPVEEITAMNALVGRSLRERRFQSALLTTFSVAALMLAAIGIYGVMSRATQERTHEIGVRMAIGAHAGDVRWMVLRAGGALAVVGIVAGSVVALALSRYMSGMLFGVTPLDPPTYLGAAAVLLGVAVLASTVPAWRASSVDPSTALRSD